MRKLVRIVFRLFLLLLVSGFLFACLFLLLVLIWYGAF
jgi:hypothetical protein